MDSKTQAFQNRRVFAYVDTGVADGIQLDAKGNVYSGCGDGVHVRILSSSLLSSTNGVVKVWDPTGKLLGKFFIQTTSANLIFAGKGRLMILAETQIFLAQIAAEGFNLAFP